MHRQMRTGARIAAAALLALGLTACGVYSGGSSGGGSGGSGGAAASGASGPGPGISTEEYVQAFSQTVYPVLTQYCSECHSGAGPGSPHIAHPDVTVAHSAVLDTQKVNLASPESSRLVRRLVADFHYCWSDCVSDGAQMAAAIQAWADLVSFSSGGGVTVADGVVSESLTLAQGVEDEGQDRYRGSLIALFEFKEGTGGVARDTSGVDPPLDLQLEGPEWMSAYGIRIESGRAIAPADTSRKLYDRIASPGAGTQQYTVEAWVTPANTDQQGPARIVSYSRGNGSRNFTLGQVLYYYNFRNRTVNPEVNTNGQPALQTADADEDLQATLQHVVVTYDQYRGRRIHVNGVFTDDVDEVAPFPLWSWDPGHQLVLGNETNNERQWEGDIRLLAIYEHALTDAQIAQNFSAGVGKRVLMRFDVSRWAGPGAYLQLVVSELDAASYLLCEPTLVTPNPNSFRVAGLRILVNGQAPVSGQAFINVDAAVTSPSQLLSPQCSVIAKDLGPAQDVFALDFEYFGEFENPRVPPPVPPPPPRVFGEMPPLEGLRSFARLRETMGVTTGVSPSTPNVRQTYLDLEQQLPSDPDLRTFSSAQQVAVSKLSLEYCDTLIETPALRDAFFGTQPPLAVDQPATTTFSDPAQRTLLIDSLVTRLVGDGLAMQPTRDEIAPVLDGLIDQLLVGCDAASCGPERTRAIAKGACAAVLASAAVSVH